MDKNKTAHMAGFTLVEFMIAMVISGLIMAAVYSAYIVQQRTATAQDEVTVMQQNIRSAMVILCRDLRMVGYDPTNDAGAELFANATFSNGGGLEEAVTSSAATIAFTADLDGDGTIDKMVEDINGDGNNDMSEMEQVAYRLNGTNLQRYATTTGAIEWQTVAENIEFIEFSYLDEDGNVTADFDKIRAVDVSILARAANPDQKFLNNGTYTMASGVTQNVNDHFRRRLSTTRVKLRNMGLL